MDYTHLTDEQKRRIVQGRLAQLEQEHYAHTLNEARQEALVTEGVDGAEAALEQTRQALAVIEAAHIVETAELAALPAADQPAEKSKRPRTRK